MTKSKFVCIFKTLSDTCKMKYFTNCDQHVLICLKNKTSEKVEQFGILSFFPEKEPN